MDPITLTTPIAPSGQTQGSESFSDLGSEDFLQLLITQLTNQDPLEPTGNEELLNQISSIRDIELSTTLTRSLEMLTGQQRFSSASSLIGQYVTGIPGDGGETRKGIVVGVRFEADGSAMLRLSDGSQLSLDQLSAVEPPLRAAEALIGRTVLGVDQRDPADPEVIEGLVTAVRVDEGGEVLLELDTGDDLRFRDYVSVAPATV